MFIVYCFDYYVNLCNCYFCFKDVNNLLLQLICLNIIKLKERQEIIRLKTYNYLI